MSRKVQAVATVLILSLLACGSLQAFPLGRPAPSADASGALTMLVEWIGSLLPWSHSHGKAPNHHPQTKGTFTVDPNGGH